MKGRKCCNKKDTNDKGRKGDGQKKSYIVKGQRD